MEPKNKGQNINRKERVVVASKPNSAKGSATFEVAAHPPSAGVSPALDVASERVAATERLLAASDPLLVADPVGFVAATKDLLLLALRKFVVLCHQDSLADMAGAQGPSLVAKVGPEMPPEVGHAGLVPHLVVACLLGALELETRGNVVAAKRSLHEVGCRTLGLEDARRGRLTRLLRCRVRCPAGGLGGGGRRPGLAATTGGLASGTATRARSAGSRGVFVVIVVIAGGVRVVASVHARKRC